MGNISSVCVGSVNLSLSTGLTGEVGWKVWNALIFMSSAVTQGVHGCVVGGVIVFATG